MVPENPVPGIRYGSFTVNGGSTYHLAASVSGKQLYVWLNNIDSGPVVAVIRKSGGKLPKVELRDAWAANSHAWRRAFETAALSLYAIGPSVTTASSIRVGEG